jgi:hypothetical protein
LRGTPPRDPLCNSRDNFSHLGLKIKEADEVVLANAWTSETAEAAFSVAESIRALGKLGYVVDAFEIFNLSDASY